ncbi:MAG: hypothetical protein ACR2IV_02260, partial [Bryobacteraceae bacterium]
ANAASEWRLSLLRCNASVASSCVLPVILTAERSLHFQLRQDKCPDSLRADPRYLLFDALGNPIAV